MYYDFIQIEKHVPYESICFDGCELYSNDVYGWETYTLKGFSPIKVKYNSLKSKLRIEGSIPYFYQGHNLFFDHSRFQEAIALISSTLKIDLSDARMVFFEFGIVLQSSCTFHQIREAHISIEGFEVQFFESGKYFIHPHLNLKIYDASKTVQKKVNKAIRDALKAGGAFDPKENYVKVENKFLKPEKYFEQELFVGDLLTEAFQNELERDLLERYSSIKKLRSIEVPDDKGSLTTMYLIMSLLYEQVQCNGVDAEKILFDKLRSIPDHLLSRQNRCDRKKVLAKQCKAIKFAKHSQYDLLEMNRAPFWFSAFSE